MSRTYWVVVDDHAVQEGAHSIEAAHVQTCETENIEMLT